MRWLVGLALVAGCHWAVRGTPSAHVFRGAAGTKPPRVLAALPVDCRNCSPRQLDAVAMQTRMGLELAGYTVVDTELVNAEVRLRLKRTREDTVGKDMERIHEELSDSRAWTQLAPGEQRELLTELGVDGVLQASIVMGYSTGAFEERVTIRLAVEQLDGTVAWRADCGVRTEGDEPRDVMIERVGRCALDSEAMW